MSFSLVVNLFSKCFAQFKTSIAESLSKNNYSVAKALLESCAKVSVLGLQFAVTDEEKTFFQGVVRAATEQIVGVISNENKNVAGEDSGGGESGAKGGSGTTLSSNATKDNSTKCNSKFEPTDISKIKDQLQDFPDNQVATSLYKTFVLPLLYENVPGLNTYNNVLLYGPPGTGKSYLASALAKTVSLLPNNSIKFFEVGASQLLSKYVGEGEKCVSALFQKAGSGKQKLSIIFFDELDAITTTRKYATTSNSILTELLRNITAYSTRSAQPVLIVGATNLPQMIDDAMLSRLSSLFYVGMPTFEERRKLIVDEMTSIFEKLQCQDPSAISTNTSVLTITQYTVGYSQRDLTAFVKEFTKDVAQDAINAQSDMSRTSLDRLYQYICKLYSDHTSVVARVKKIAEFIKRSTSCDTFKILLKDFSLQRDFSAVPSLEASIVTCVLFQSLSVNPADVATFSQLKTKITSNTVANMVNHGLNNYKIIDPNDENKVNKLVTRILTQEMGQTHNESTAPPEKASFVAPEVITDVLGSSAPSQDDAQDQSLRSRSKRVKTTSATPINQTKTTTGPSSSVPPASSLPPLNSAGKTNSLANPPTSTPSIPSGSSLPLPLPVASSSVPSQSFLSPLSTSYPLTSLLPTTPPAFSVTPSTASNTTSSVTPLPTYNPDYNPNPDSDYMDYIQPSPAVAVKGAPISVVPPYSTPIGFRGMEENENPIERPFSVPQNNAGKNSIWDLTGAWNSLGAYKSKN